MSSFRTVKSFLQVCKAECLHSTFSSLQFFHFEMITIVKLRCLFLRIMFDLRNKSNYFDLLDCSTLKNRLFSFHCEELN